jgi:hypothetical protein
MSLDDLELDAETRELTQGYLLGHQQPSGHVR